MAKTFGNATLQVPCAGAWPSGWRRTTLGMLQHFLTSGSRGWAPFYSDSGALFVRITNLTRHGINLDLSKCRFVSLPKSNSEGRRTRLRNGDLLISITADLGLIAHYSTPKLHSEAYVNQHIALLRITGPDVDTKFVAYQLSAPWAQKRFKQITDRGAKTGLGLGAIRSFPILLPLIHEQHVITEVLDCWNEVIRVYEKKIEKKQNVKKGLTHKLLSGELRLPGFSKEWGSDKVQNLADIGTGCSDTKDKFPNGKYPFYVRSPKPETIDSYTYDGTAVLTAGDGNIGKIFHFVTGKFNYHQRVYRISDFNPILSPRFFFEYFRLNFIRQARRYSAKTSVDSVRMEMIADMTVPLPPLEEQAAIARILSAAEDEIHSLEQRLSSLQEQKRYLLNNLVTGAIRLPQFLKQETNEEGTSNE